MTDSGGGQSTSDTERFALSLVTCGRCGSEVDVSDLETDPRWKEVCDRCHAELVAEYGECQR